MILSIGRTYGRSGGNSANIVMSLIQRRSFSSTQNIKRSLGVTTGLLVAGSVGAIIYALENAVSASDFVAHPHKIAWSHLGLAASFDYRSVRRGYEVYKQVCAACHSLKFLKYRHFIDVFMTEEEVKAEAAEALIDDIDDEGKAVKRPGKPNDHIPMPYPNDKAAAAANDGAIPPDLTLIALARHGNDDYLFSLLTGYFDAPAGVQVDDGKAYNPYFLGGVISMPQQLFDDGIEYADGTPATQSQQAKDVTTFLHWCAEPYHDTRKMFSWKILPVLPILAVVLVYAKRHVWTIIKSEKHAWRVVKGREPPPTTS